MSRYIFSKNSRWYISEVFDPSDSKLQEKATYYTLTDDVTGPYYAVGTSDSVSIGVSYVPVVEPAGAIEAGYINAEGNFQPLSFDGTQASNSGSAVAGLQHKIFNTGIAEPQYGGAAPVTSTDFYKCTYVNSDSWGGRKAVLNDGVYSFQSNSTQGLSYDAVKPSTGKVYDSTVSMLVTLYNTESMALYIRFQVDQVRSSQIQLSRFVLVKDYAEVSWSSLPVQAVSADPENSSPQGQQPSKILDNSTSTKWYSGKFNQPSYAQIQFSSPVCMAQFSGYRWYTAGDESWRDPISWQVMVSMDGQSWTVLSKVQQYDTTTVREAMVGEWNFE